MERIEKKPRCSTCRKLKQHRNSPPPCSECVPELYESNRDAAKIWNLVQDQRIWVGGGMGEPISVALEQAALWKLLDEFKVQDRIKTFIKVLKVFEHFHGIEMRQRAMRNSK